MLYDCFETQNFHNVCSLGKKLSKNKTAIVYYPSHSRPKNQIKTILIISFQNATIGSLNPLRKYLDHFNLEKTS